MELTPRQIEILLSMIKLIKGCCTTLNRIVIMALKEDSQLDTEATKRILKFGVSAEINMMLGFLRDIEHILKEEPFDPK